MLDKRTAKMMENILRMCDEGSYKIIEISDLIKAMLPRYKFDSTSVSQTIKYLSGIEMIDIKYSDENVYCIAVLPKGRIFDESKDMKKYESIKISKKTLTIMIAGCFLAAFAGALLANVIIDIIRN